MEPPPVQCRPSVHHPRAAYETSQCRNLESSLFGGTWTALLCKARYRMYMATFLRFEPHLESALRVSCSRVRESLAASLHGCVPSVVSRSNRALRFSSSDQAETPGVERMEAEHGGRATLLPWQSCSAPPCRALSLSLRQAEATGAQFLPRFDLCA